MVSPLCPGPSCALSWHSLWAVWSAQQWPAVCVLIPVPRQGEGGAGTRPLLRLFHPGGPDALQSLLLSLGRVTSPASQSLSCSEHNYLFNINNDHNGLITDSVLRQGDGVLVTPLGSTFSALIL